MSTLRVNSLLNAAGTATPAIDGLAKAWVNFNGQGTVAIRGSFNVSSITDNGTGQYTVNFTTAMSDANYGVNFTGGGGQSSRTMFTCVDSESALPTVSNVRLIIRNYANVDMDAAHCFVTIHR